MVRDPKDNPVVAAALEGDAEYILSEDDDLLVLKDHHVKGHNLIRCMKPRLANSHDAPLTSRRSTSLRIAARARSRRRCGAGAQHDPISQLYIDGSRELIKEDVIRRGAARSLREARSE